MRYNIASRGPAELKIHVYHTEKLYNLRFVFATLLRALVLNFEFNQIQLEYLFAEIDRERAEKK